MWESTSFHLCIGRNASVCDAVVSLALFLWPRSINTRPPTTMAIRSWGVACHCVILKVSLLFPLVEWVACQLGKLGLQRMAYACRWCNRFPLSLADNDLLITYRTDFLIRIVKHWFLNFISIAIVRFDSASSLHMMYVSANVKYEFMEKQIASI